MDELKMISEIDIKDLTELYKLQIGDKFRFIDGDPKDDKELYKFLGVDGMYAKIRQFYATSGTLDFVAAWTKVRKA